MSTPTNDDRAYWASEALDTFRRLTAPNEDTPTLLRDLLANLMHLADKEGIDFAHELNMATMHYEAEAGEAE